MYCLESDLFLCTVHFSDVTSGNSYLHSKYFWWTVVKVFCFCVRYTFLMYRMESVLFLCTVHIFNVPSGKRSVSVHCKHLWYTAWNVFFSMHTTYFWCPMFWYLYKRFLVQVLFCSHCFDVNLPWRRQFQSMSNM